MAASEKFQMLLNKLLSTLPENSSFRNNLTGKHIFSIQSYTRIYVRLCGVKGQNEDHITIHNVSLFISNDLDGYDVKNHLSYKLFRSSLYRCNFDLVY